MGRLPLTLVVANDKHGTVPADILPAGIVLSPEG